jgi:putative membrane protein
MRIVAAIVAAASLGTAPASAQIGNPAGMDPGTPQAAPGKPAPNYPNAQDKLFVHLAATGGMAEVQAAKLARSRAESDAVKGFADRMAKEHGKANSRLQGLAKKAAVPLPKEVDPDHKLMRAELEQLRGKEFDIAYMQAQVIDHQKTAQILLWEMSQGQDAQLQRYAADTLPDVLEHLEHAKSILETLTGAAPRNVTSINP